MIIFFFVLKEKNENNRFVCSETKSRELDGTELLAVIS